MSPILLAIAAAVAVMMGRPVLFVQRRLGLDGTEFELIKFRTMTMATSEDGTPLPEKERLTAFGSLLRQTSLDELPELFNIAKGEMAFVGPRPLPVRYRDRDSPEEFRRHAVLPGLTGWAQVNGRNATSWNDRLAMDQWYVDHRSLRLDLEIMAKTLTSVLRRDGISAPGHATMSEMPPWTERQSQS